MRDANHDYGEVSAGGFIETHFDFTRCERPDGSAYGTAGQCRKGTPADKEPDVENIARLNSLAESMKEISSAEEAGRDARMADIKSTQPGTDDSEFNVAQAYARVLIAEEDYNTMKDAFGTEASPYVRMADDRVNQLTQETFQAYLHHRGPEVAQAFDQKFAAAAQAGDQEMMGKLQAAINKATRQHYEAYDDGSGPDRLVDVSPELAFSEFDFATCRRSDGTTYGTRGDCVQKGAKKVDPSSASVRKGKSSPGRGKSASRGRLNKYINEAKQSIPVMSISEHMDRQSYIRREGGDSAARPIATANHHIQNYNMLMTATAYAYNAGDKQSGAALTRAMVDSYQKGMAAVEKIDPTWSSRGKSMKSIIGKKYKNGKRNVENYAKRIGMSVNSPSRSSGSGSLGDVNAVLGALNKGGLLSNAAAMNRGGGGSKPTKRVKLGTQKESYGPEAFEVGGYSGGTLRNPVMIQKYKGDGKLYAFNNANKVIGGPYNTVNQATNAWR